MAKLADDARSWQVRSFDAPLIIGENALPDGVLLVFIHVSLDRDRKLVVPLEPH